MLLVANLAPLVGVLWFGWDAAVIILVYWTENLVTGFYNILRMLFLRMESPVHHLAKIFVLSIGGDPADNSDVTTVWVAYQTDAGNPEYSRPGGN